MFKFYLCCVAWPDSDVHAPGGLCDMIEAASMITRRTFLAHVNRAQLRILETDLSYYQHPRQGLTMAGDFAVSYHRSQLHGRRVYYFRQSAIEYVFTWEPGEAGPGRAHRPRLERHVTCTSPAGDH